MRVFGTSIERFALRRAPCAALQHGWGTTTIEQMRQRLADYRLFWREFRHTFSSTGAVSPSGKSLAKALAKHIAPSVPQRGTRRTAESGTRQRILEVGPGTGPVTSQIIQQMGPDDTLDLVELNPRFVAVLERRLQEDRRWQQVAKRVRVHPLPIEELPVAEPYDVIISGLPLNNFPCQQVEAILGHFHQLAAAGAMLSFFEYIALRKAKSLLCNRSQRRRLSGIESILAREFSAWQVDRQCILANVPPAWVHHLRLPGNSK